MTYIEVEEWKNGILLNDIENLCKRIHTGFGDRIDR